jgi:predicted MFS family arabinose efflux permease
MNSDTEHVGPLPRDKTKEESDRIELASRLHSPAYVWYVVILLSVVNVFNSMDRMALAVLAPHIKADLHLSDGQLGLLTGFAFAVFYAICGVPIARWADRGIRRNITALALATWSAMTALSGAALNFWHLFIARVGVGAGEAGGLAPALSLICDYVPPKRRPGVIAIHSIGLISGMMVGMGLASRLGEAIGWRWTFVVIGTPGLLFALIVRFTLREPARGFFDVDRERQEDSASFIGTLAVLWREKTYRLLMFVSVLNGFIQYGFSQWWPSFYARVFGVELAVVGVYLGLAIGVGSGIGLLLGGFLSNRAARRDIRLPLMIGAAAIVLAVPAALGSLFVSSATTSIVLVSVTVLLWSVQSAPVVATVYGTAPATMRATAGAVMTFFTSVLGFGLGPVCVGFLSDILSKTVGVEALRYALLAPALLLPFMAMGTYAAAKALTKNGRSAAAHAERQPANIAATGVAVQSGRN